MGTTLGQQNALRNKIVLAAAVILGLMILFPPKYTFRRDPIFEQVTSESAGYHLFFDDPAAEQKKAARFLFGDEVDKYIGSGIEWGKLILQLAVVSGATFALLRFTKRDSS